MKALWPTLIAGSLLLPQLAFADVSYQETMKLTGGSMMGMVKMAGMFSSQAKQLTAPTTSTVMIHGGQMVTSNPHSTSIIDLDQQTITEIDHDKHTYSVVTFQQMQQAMTDAAAKMNKSKGSQPAAGDPQMKFTAHVTNTGATREIDGQTAKEALLTIVMTPTSNDPNMKGGMAATSEMWLVKEEPGMAELRRFNERMAKELSVTMSNSGMSALLGAQPGGAEALDELKKEANKVSGIPVLQVTRLGMSVDGQPLAAPSVAPLPASQKGQGSSAAGDVTKEVAAGTATQEAGNQIAKLGAFGRALGGSSMGALMKHGGNSAATPSATPAATADPATAGVLMENQIQTSGFSVAPVDPSSFQVPAGYKQVQSPMTKK